MSDSLGSWRRTHTCGVLRGSDAGQTVTLMGWALWRQKVTRTFLAGMVVAIAGMFLLVGPNFSIGGQRSHGSRIGHNGGLHVSRQESLPSPRARVE